ncbi:angiopoietin-1 receptor-like [Patiria miniata]|uniref:Uncharacterized protein n=1 Tax=Patiria miniata TaxID=46514 RepID=A0A914ASE3_PATMI|nr:angiopoietin-1 receptor-like [Patiria miniata]
MAGIMEVRLQLAWQLLLFLGQCKSVSAFVDFTCITKPRIDIYSEDTYIAGYLHGGNATLSFARTTYTSFDNINDQLGLPSVHYYLETHSSSTGGKISILLLPAPGGKTRIGAFACRAVMTGRGRPNISIGTVIMSKTADFLPTRVSRTANRGDAVNLTVTATDPYRTNTRWRKDGSAPYLHQRDSFNFDIANVTLSDSGVYEVHSAGERSTGKQALMRLIFRACQKDKWNAPSCDRVCPVCFNGGMCDDWSGDCICPPGFSGQFCGIPKGTNCFGQNGSFRCDSPELGGGPTCAGMLFCLPDPYGCSCAAGYQGIDCNETCGDGFYGADCGQTCHCMDGVACDGINCQDRTTGECFGVCAPRFTGIINCRFICPCFTEKTFIWQPVNCPNGTVIVNYVYKFVTVESDQELEAVRTEGNSVSVHLPLCGTLYEFEVAAETTKGIGPFSYKSIFASFEEVPDAVDGLTVQGTSHNGVTLLWEVPGTSQEYPCPTSDYLVTFDLINLEQCLEVHQHGGSVTTTNTSITLRGLKAYSTYNVSITPRNQAGNGTTSSAQFTTGETVPQIPPEFKSSSATTDSITWTWNPIPCGSRGGNITGYRTRLFRPDGLLGKRGDLTTSVTYTGLEPCTNYTLAVQAYTSEGGGPSVTLHQQTATAVPDAVSDISIHVISRERNEFDVRWTSSDGACPATSYSVTYELITMDRCTMQNPPIITDVGTVDTTHATLHLPAYYSKYRVSVAPINEAGHGEENSMVIDTKENTPTAAPVIRSTASNNSITFSWDPIPCGSRRGNITHYEYRFRDPGPYEEVNSIKKRNISKLSVTFHDLSPCTTYSFRVRAYTRIGAGLWTNWTHQDTVVIDEIHSLNLQPSTNEIKASWTTAGNEDNPCPLTSYRVSYQLLNLEQCQPRTDPAVIRAAVVNGSDISITSMHAYSTYSVQVVPANNDGANYLKSKTVTTDEGG